MFLRDHLQYRCSHDMIGSSLHRYRRSTSFHRHLNPRRYLASISCFEASMELAVSSFTKHRHKLTCDPRRSRSIGATMRDLLQNGDEVKVPAYFTLFHHRDHLPKISDTARAFYPSNLVNLVDRCLQRLPSERYVNSWI